MHSEENASRPASIPGSSMSDHNAPNTRLAGEYIVSLIKQALSFIPSDDRDIWIRCGMAIKAALGEAGFEIWDQWSSTSDKYQAREAASIWRSFKPAGGVNIGTLFYIAQQHGYQRDHNNTPLVVTPEEAAAREAIRKAEAKLLRSRRETAAAKAVSIWDDSADTLTAMGQPNDSHPYVFQRNVHAHGARVYHGSLVIGGMDCDGALVISMSLNQRITSLQFINRDGEKRFLPDGEKGGYLLGTIKPRQPVCICEGFVTGCSIHEATDYAVIVAFDAGNLQKMAKALRANRTSIPIIVCADDDHATPGNPGLTKANEAARGVKGQVAVPDFGRDRPSWATDFNDMAKLTGKESVRQVIMTAVAQARKALQSRTMDSRGVYKKTVELTCASNVKMIPISWLWNGYLAAGKLHILGGAPGTGKTTIGMALASIVTTGGDWPDGEKSPVGNVVIWSGEDDPSDTLVPRLVQAEADLDKVHFVAGVRDGDEKRPFDPARDMRQLHRALADIGGASLLIIDPIVSAIVGDSHKNAEVRRGLQPLADLAASENCAVLGITHFSKGTAGRDPVERITGSLAFGAVARVVMVAAKNQEENEEGGSTRLFLRVKSNIGPDDGGFEYELQQTELETKQGIYASAVVWGDRVEGTARDLLAAADATSETGKGSALSYAEAFLSGLLAKGPVNKKEIEALALQAGYSMPTIERAKTSMNIKSVKVGGNFGGSSSKWTWELPTAEGDQDDQRDQGCEKGQSEESGEGDQQKKMSAFSKFDHLQDDEDLVVEEI